MYEELNSRISRFIDDELDKHEALELLQEVRNQSDLNEKMRRYEVISHAIKSDAFLPVDSDFVSRVSKQLEHEPVYLIPKQKPTKQRYLKIAAMAASIAVAVVVVEQVVQKPSGIFPTQLMMAENMLDQKMAPVYEFDRQLEYPYEVVVADNQSDQNSLPDERFDHYLQAHSGNLYASGSNYKAYAQVASFGQK